jgi:hypothetical protein
MTGIFIVPISSYFYGKNFLNFVSECKDRFDIIVFGIEKSNNCQLIINPGKTYNINNGDYALVFALSEYHSQAVSLYEHDPNKIDAFVNISEYQFNEKTKAKETVTEELKYVKIENENEEKIKKKNLFELLRVVAPIDYINENLNDDDELEEDSFYENIFQHFQILSHGRKKEDFLIEKSKLKNITNHIIISVFTFKC